MTAAPKQPEDVLVVGKRPRRRSTSTGSNSACSGCDATSESPTSSSCGGGPRELFGTPITLATTIASQKTENLSESEQNDIQPPLNSALDDPGPSDGIFRDTTSPPEHSCGPGGGRADGSPQNPDNINDNNSNEGIGQSSWELLWEHSRDESSNSSQAVEFEYGSILGGRGSSSVPPSHSITSDSVSATTDSHAMAAATQRDEEKQATNEEHEALDAELELLFGGEDNVSSFREDAASAYNLSEYDEYTVPDDVLQDEYTAPEEDLEEVTVQSDDVASHESSTVVSVCVGYYYSQHHDRWLLEAQQVDAVPSLFRQQQERNNKKLCDDSSETKSTAHATLDLDEDGDHETISVLSQDDSLPGYDYEEVSVATHHSDAQSTGSLVKEIVACSSGEIAEPCTAEESKEIEEASCSSGEIADPCQAQESEKVQVTACSSGEIADPSQAQESEKVEEVARSSGEIAEPCAAQEACCLKNKSIEDQTETPVRGSDTRDEESHREALLEDMNINATCSEKILANPNQEAEVSNEANPHGCLEPRIATTRASCSESREEPREVAYSETREETPVTGRASEENRVQVVREGLPQEAQLRKYPVVNLTFLANPLTPAKIDRAVRDAWGILEPGGTLYIWHVVIAPSKGAAIETIHDLGPFLPENVKKCLQPVYDVSDAQRMYEAHTHEILKNAGRGHMLPASDQNENIHRWQGVKPVT